MLVNEEELRECIFLIIFNVTTDKNYELSELKTRMDIELIHSSVTKECFVVDLMTDDGMFDEAMKWLAEAIIERL